MTLSVKYLSRSCFRLQGAGRTVYIDPGSIERRADLPPADLILVTHHHGDHVRRGTVARLTGDGTLAVGTAKACGKLGPRKIVVRPGKSVEAQGIAVSAVHAYNPRGSTGIITFHPQGVGVGYVLSIDGRRLYHAGDTGLIEEMSGLGPVDLAFLPIGGRYTMDLHEAVEAVGRIRPRFVVPMHRLKADPQEFKRKVEEATSAKAVVLAEGEEFTL